MTIRDISVAFGFEVDKSSQANAENSIKGLKNMATKLLGKIAVVFSVVKLTQFASDCVDAASNVEEMENKFNTVFGHLSDGVDQWAEDFAHSVRRNKNTIKTYLADQQNLLVGFGMTREEGSKLSEEMTTLALDIASFANQDEDVAVNAMTKAVMGQSEAARVLGAVLNDDTRAETMLALGMNGTYQSLSQLEKMEVNYQTILRQSPDAVGDCVRSIGSYESSMRQLKSVQQEFKEFIGGQLLPVMSVFVQWVTKGVKAAENFSKAILLDAQGNNRILMTFERIHAVVKRLQPAIDRMTQTLRNGINKGIDVVKNIANRFGGMENILKILGVAAAAFVVAMNWSKIVGGAKVFFNLLKGLKAVFAGISPTILAVVAVVVILFLIIEDFINFLMGNDSVIGTVLDKLGIGANNAREKVFAAFKKIKEFLLNVWDVIKTGAGIFVDTVNGFFERHGESIRKNFEGVWGIIKTFLNGVWTFISAIAGAIFGKTEDDIEGANQSTGDKILSIWGAILKTLFAVWDALYEAGSAIFNAIATVIETVFGWIQVFWENWGNRIVSWFQVLWDAVGGILHGFLDIVMGVANFISSVFTGDWEGAWTAIKDIFTGIWEVIVGYFTVIWETIKMLIEMSLAAIQSIWESMWTAISSFFEGIWNGILDFVTGIIDGISSVVMSIKDTIVNGIQSAIDWIKGLPAQAVQWGSDIINGIVDGIKGAIGAVGDAVKGVADTITSFLHFSVPDEGPLTDFQNWMPDFMQGLADGISSSEGTLLDKVQGVAGSIKALMEGATASAATAASSQINNATSNMTQNVNINNSYSGGTAETQRNISTAMKKSAVDATTQMARGLAYARG